MLFARTEPTGPAAYTLARVRTLAAALVQCMRDSQHITIAAFCYIQTGVREAEVYQDRVI